MILQLILRVERLLALGRDIAADVEGREEYY